MQLAKKYKEQRKKELPLSDIQFQLQISRKIAEKMTHMYWSYRRNVMICNSKSLKRRIVERISLFLVHFFVPAFFYAAILAVHFKRDQTKQIKRHINKMSLHEHQLSVTPFIKSPSQRNTIQIVLHLFVTGQH